MPQIIGIKPLSQLCVDFVINNMPVLCQKPTVTSNLAGVDQGLVHDPFDPLPSKFLEDIIHALLTKGCLKKFFRFLSTPQLVKLDLRNMKKKDDCSNQFLLESTRCVYLKHLALWPFKIEAKYFASIIPIFDKLQVLDISNTGADDSCLELIGTYCSDLRELKCVDCVNITDSGVKGLCVSSAHEREDSDSKLGLRRSFQKFCSHGSSITISGIQMALENLTNLKMWDMATVQSLAKIHNEDYLSKFSEIPKYSLNKLEVSPHEDYIPKTLGLVVSMCPSVVEVEISTSERLTNGDLLSLLSLENLCILNIGGYLGCGGRVTFAGGVTPILKTFGNSLKSLSLSSLSKVNIRIIAELCPNLHFLSLNSNFSYSTAKLEEECTNIELPILKQLEKLSLRAIDSKSTIPRENLISLLSSPSLVRIDIERCCSLDDDVLKEVARVQQFQNLEYLEISVCHNVTEDGMDVFLNTENPLKKMAIYFCRQLRKSDIDCWEDHASLNNWQIVFSHEEYHPYCHDEFFEDEEEYEDDDEDDDEDDYEDDYEDDEDEELDDEELYFPDDYTKNYFLGNAEYFKEFMREGITDSEVWDEFTDGDDEDY